MEKLSVLCWTNSLLSIRKRIKQHFYLLVNNDLTIILTLEAELLLFSFRRFCNKKAKKFQDSWDIFTHYWGFILELIKTSFTTESFRGILLHLSWRAFKQGSSRGKCRSLSYVGRSNSVLPLCWLYWTNASVNTKQF